MSGSHDYHLYPYLLIRRPLSAACKQFSPTEINSPEEFSCSGFKERNLTKKDFDCFYKTRLTNSLKGGKMEPSIHDTARHIQVLLVITMMMMMHCDSDDDYNCDDDDRQLCEHGFQTSDTLVMMMMGNGDVHCIQQISQTGWIQIYGLRVRVRPERIQVYV